MDIKFYNNSSDNRCVKKVLLSEFVISGTMRDSSSIIKPVIKVSSPEKLRYNYAYIPEFNRYYFITDNESLRTGLWELSLKVDPLMSFKADILALKVVVDKQAESTNGDEYIDDGSLVTNNLTYNMTYNFPNGFNDSGEYILITAG